MSRAYFLLALLAAACSSGDETNKDASSSSGTEAVRLYALECGRIAIQDLASFSSNGAYAGRQHNVVVSCFLIRHPDGDLMWDAGLPDALNAQPDGATSGPFHLTVPTTLESQLAEIGATPEDIEFFSVSHSHFDHVGNAGMFVSSTFLVDSDERTHMFRDEARADAETFGLVAPLEGAETVEFDGDYDVFGDGSAMIIATPGHTPGHTSLLVNLENAGPVLLSGDLYHLIESREKRIVPSFNTDEAQTLESMDKFEALAEETDARVVIQHSEEHFDALPTPPEYLD